MTNYSKYKGPGSKLSIRFGLCGLFWGMFVRNNLTTAFAVSYGKIMVKDRTKIPLLFL